jgi:PAS domain S-box-containing protein
VNERRQSPPAAPLGYIERLPAQLVLDRLPVPMWAVHGGKVIYANRAFEEMLGHPVGGLGGTAAADLIVGGTGAGVSVASMLRERAGRLLNLRHADGSVMKVIVSFPMLLREDDPVTLTGVQDVTEYVWEKGS